MHLIFNCYEMTSFEGLFIGPARICIFPLREVTFDRLSSDRAKIAALRKGFSPPVNLPARVPFEDGGYTDSWTLTGETIEPIFMIYLPYGRGAEFFDPEI